MYGFFTCVICVNVNKYKENGQTLRRDLCVRDRNVHISLYVLDVEGVRVACGG